MAKKRNRKNKSKLATTELPTKSKLPKGSELNKQIPYHDKKPLFCFRYYDHKDKEFSVKCINKSNDFYLLFERLRSISNLTWGQICSGEQFHAHEITWTKTSRHLGFDRLKDISEKYEPFQFKIFKECRIIGFFDYLAIFNIVWLDRNHKLFPRK